MQMNFREASGPAEALFVLSHAERGMTTFTLPARQDVPGLTRLQRGPSALRFTNQ